LLYLVATPIGNLGDITYRALETLKTCDYILCEDTRHSLSLLNHYEISKPLKSFHKFSDDARIKEIIQDLLSGNSIALISDAGTPGISDPGTFLVQQCVENEINVISIPGACAAITALACSGLNTDRFQFFGFLPRKTGELRTTLQDLLTYSGTTICYESPNRLLDTLKSLQELAPKRKIVVCRELTKKFEEVKRGTAEELIGYWESHTLKGEIVLLINGEQQCAAEEWQQLTPEEHVALLQESYSLSRQEAIKMAAKMRGVPKRDLYKIMHTQSKDE
jgi:16S rRNA (cytidine1402-2'-O)-methyltransferase